MLSAPHYKSSRMWVKELSLHREKAGVKPAEREVLFTPSLGRKPKEVIASDFVAGGFPTDMGEGGVNLAIPLVSVGDSTHDSNPFLAKFRQKFASMGMWTCNVNVFCKTLKTSNFRNCLQPVMRYGEFRGDFQKMAPIFTSCLYTIF